MARGTLKLGFRFEVEKVINGGNDPLLFEAGEYAGATANPQDNQVVFSGENDAIAKALGWQRKFQSMGVDTTATVYARILGDEADNPKIPLTGGDGGGGIPDLTTNWRGDNEQIVAKLDAVPRYVKQRVGLANAEYTGTGFALVAADDGQDLGNVA
jgi:hypothetical protein